MKINKFKHLLDLTIKNIFRRKVRSILTILSVVIGIGAIVALLLLSQGLLNAVESQFDVLGSNTIFIFPSMSSDNIGPSQSVSSRLSDKDVLTIKDVDILRNLPMLDEVYALTSFINEFKYKSELQYALTIVTPSDDIDALLDLMQLDFAQGHGFEGKTGRKVIIGSYFADGLFNNKIKLGSTIKINDVDFKVIGVLKSVGSVEDDSSVYISREVAKNLFVLNDEVKQIMAKSKSNFEVLDAKEEIQDRLEKTHDDESFIVVTANQIMDMVKGIITVLRVIMLTIAGISVVVGSIGVMNSIYTSVLERTGEIGILKSIGAKINDIILLFVIESVLLSLIGGFLGLGLGISIAKIVEWYAINNNFSILHIDVAPFIVIVALLLSIVIGLISGILPAKKAAKLNPVDALRKIT